MSESFAEDSLLPNGSIDPASLPDDPEGVRRGEPLVSFQVAGLPLKIADRLSPNRRARPEGAEVNLIVIHYDESARAASTLAEVLSPKTQKSYHALIARDASIIYRIVPAEERADHAGASEWPEATTYRPGKLGKPVGTVNDHSLGLALGNTGTEDYPADQLALAAAWCAYAMSKYPAITMDRIVGHADVAIPRGRKRDPGPQFPWDHFRYLVKLELDQLRNADHDTLAAGESEL